MRIQVLFFRGTIAALLLAALVHARLSRGKSQCFPKEVKNFQLNQLVGDWKLINSKDDLPQDYDKESLKKLLTTFEKVGDGIVMTLKAATGEIFAKSIKYKPTDMEKPNQLVGQVPEEAVEKGKSMPQQLLYILAFKPKRYLVTYSTGDSNQKFYGYFKWHTNPKLNRKEYKVIWKALKCMGLYSDEKR